MPPSTKIVLVTHGSTGDHVPFLRLGSTLRRRGHQVVLLASSVWEVPAHDAGLLFRPIPPSGGHAQQVDMMRRLAVHRRPLDLLTNMYRLALPWIGEVMATLRAELPDASALVYSYLFPVYRNLARDHGVPTAALHLCPNTRADARHPPDPVPALPPFLPVGLRRAFSGWIARAADRTVTRRLNQLLSPSGIAVESILRRPADVSLVNASPAIYGADQADGAPWVFTGFFRDPVDDSPGGASGQAGSPFVTFGSIADPVLAHQFRVLAGSWPKNRPLRVQAGWLPPPDALRDRGVTFVPPGPHGALFRRAAAIVHHGGAGTTAAALHAGRPQVVVPHFADQPFWAREVERLGVGISLDPATWAQALPHALDTLAADPGFARRAQDLAATLSRENGLETAAAEIENLLPKADTAGDPIPCPAFT